MDPPRAPRPATGWGGFPRWQWASVAIVGLIAGTALATAPARAAKAEADRQERVAIMAEIMAPLDVLYEVEGTASVVAVTIEKPSGTEQANVSVPLTNKGGTRGLTLKFERGDFVYISAQNQGESGTVTCRITVDGEVLSENTSSGAYSIASCKGSV
jgi:hypothetical protein